MGIDIFSARFLASERRRGVSFARLLTLGHQSVYMDAGKYRAVLDSLKGAVKQTDYADDLFHALGATDMDVMDVSDYEGGTVIHDLNDPVAGSLHGKYDCVFDGGSLEHVFNFPVALKNCMEMVKVGGSFITITPANNYCGHGFYQFSPELFYTALSPLNGFKVERLLFAYRDQWYAPRTFEEVKARILLVTGEPVQIFVSARRIEQKAIFQNWPQQPDYVQVWQEPGAQNAAPEKGMKETLVKMLPFVKALQTRWRKSKERRLSSPNNSAWFTRVELDE